MDEWIFWRKTLESYELHFYHNSVPQAKYNLVCPCQIVWLCGVYLSDQIIVKTCLLLVILWYIVTLSKYNLFHVYLHSLKFLYCPDIPSFHFFILWILRMNFATNPHFRLDLYIVLSWWHISQRLKSDDALEDTAHGMHIIFHLFWTQLKTNHYIDIQLS